MAVQSGPEQERIRFLQFLTNDGTIAAGVTSAAFEDENGVANIGLEKLRSQFGNNFNTLIVLNTGAVSMDVLLDGKTVTTVSSSNGSFNIEARDGVIYNSLSFKNIDGATALADNALRITVGRTGV